MTDKLKGLFLAAKSLKTLVKVKKKEIKLNNHNSLANKKTSCAWQYTVQNWQFNFYFTNLTRSKFINYRNQQQQTKKIRQHVCSVDVLIKKTCDRRQCTRIRVITMRPGKLSGRDIITRSKTKNIRKKIVHCLQTLQNTQELYVIYFCY